MSPTTKPASGCVCKTGKMRLDRIRHQPIVGIKKNYILTGAGTEARVARFGQTPIFLSHTFHRG